MACPVNYNPNPPKAWYRVESPCPYGTIGLANLYEIEMSRKGNILQYKINSSNLTKNQKYSQIAKGMWTNRTKTWASQSATVSMPNTHSLKRVNYTTIDINGNPIRGPITCPVPPAIPIFQTLLPNPGPGPKPGPTVPPVPPIPSANTFTIPFEEPPTVTPPIILPDGGNLICNIVENICTGEILETSKTNFCNPTTDSDVPGPVMNLCYNPGIHQTYYPRQRYVTPVSGAISGDKFPIGYKFLKAA
jgi:hypothetical protein